MATMRILRMNPGRAYVSADLFLPLRDVHLPSIKEALNFWVDDPKQDEGGYWLKQWEVIGNHVRVPRHFLESDVLSQDYKVVDLRPPRQRVKITSRITPREDQIEITRALDRSHHGTLNIACGRGKTVMAFYKIAREQTPAIIVVPTKDLLEQWKADIPTFLDFRGGIGHVQGKKFDWKHPVTLAMIHTLAFHQDWPEEFRRYFGLAFFDEGDLAGAPIFSRASNLFYGERFALTATANRTDGNDAIYQYHLGRIFHTDLEQKLTPITYFHYTGIDLPRYGQDGDVERGTLWDLTPRDGTPVDDLGEEDIHHGKLAGWLGRQNDRNLMIVDEIQRGRHKGRKILLLSHSVDHLHALHEMVPNSGLIVGSVKQKDRAAQLHNYPVVFATMHLARRGLNRPDLDTLHLLTPFRNANDYQQATGRILRDLDGKTQPVVMVWVDEMMKSQLSAIQLKRLARKQGHIVEDL